MAATTTDTELVLVTSPAWLEVLGDVIAEGVATDDPARRITIGIDGDTVEGVLEAIEPEKGIATVVVSVGPIGLAVDRLHYVALDKIAWVARNRPEPVE